MEDQKINKTTGELDYSVLDLVSGGVGDGEKPPTSKKDGYGPDKSKDASKMKLEWKE